MATRGAEETNKLKQNMEEQLNRLLSQLEDCEEMKEELDEDEYNETRRDTLEQLEEFRASLERMASGDLTLVDHINSVQLAVQAAVSEAFRTPEVIRLFAKKQPGQLRDRLSVIERELKLQKITEDEYKDRAVELLSALKKLDQKITPEEESFLQKNMTDAARSFHNAGKGGEVGDDAQAAILRTAGDQIKGARS